MYGPPCELGKTSGNQGDKSIAKKPNYKRINTPLILGIILTCQDWADGFVNCN